MFVAASLITTQTENNSKGLPTGAETNCSTSIQWNAAQQ